MSSEYLCPVCGFGNLSEQPYDADGKSCSFEICPSCGFQFGVTDGDLGISFERYRQEWINEGCPWKYGIKPDGWSAEEQLKALRNYLNNPHR